MAFKTMRKQEMATIDVQRELPLWIAQDRRVGAFHSGTGGSYCMIERQWHDIGFPHAQKKNRNEFGMLALVPPLVKTIAFIR